MLYVAFSDCCHLNDFPYKQEEEEVEARRGNTAEQFSFQLIFFSRSSCLVLFLSHSSVFCS
jgi:hypothetical protein